MKIHYETETNKILCNQKVMGCIQSKSRFSYKVGNPENCKNCDKILKAIAEKCNGNNICTSFKKLGYETRCNWRDDKYCRCIDGCRFKRFN